MNRFLMKPLLFAFLIIIIPSGVYAQYFLLPEGIVQSYFPVSEQYTIPEDRRVLQIINRAKSYEAKGNYRQAARYYGFAYTKARDSKAAPFIRFKQCYFLENLQESIEGLKEITRLYPDFPYNDAVRWELARRNYLSGNYDECVLALQEILNSESGKVEIFTPYVLSFLGITYQAMKKNDDAINAHFEAIERLAENRDDVKKKFIVRNYLEISRVWLAEKEYARALDLLRRIIGSGEEAVIQQEAYILLAEALEASGEIEKAYLAYSKLLKSYPASIYLKIVEERIQKLGIKEESIGETYSPDIYDMRILEGRYKFGEESPLAQQGVQKGGVFIQIGSFSIEKNAKDLAGLLKAKGFSVLIVEALLDEKRIFRVRVGPIATVSKAKGVMKELEKLGYKGFILKEQ